MQNYDLVIASDHAGYKLKEKIIKYLAASKPEVSVMNYGTWSEDSVDYPDYTKPVTDAIINEEAPRGILICGTGIGMSVAANRNSDIHAALCVDVGMAEKARQHNDANVLALGARVISQDVALACVETFLITKAEGGRHAMRVEKLSIKGETI